MSKNNTNAIQFAGPYLIQDMDHMGTPNTQPAKAKSNNARQAQQGHSGRTSSAKSSGPRQAH